MHSSRLGFFASGILRVWNSSRLTFFAAGGAAKPGWEPGRGRGERLSQGTGAVEGEGAATRGRELLMGRGERLRGRRGGCSAGGGAVKWQGAGPGL